MFKITLPCSGSVTDEVDVQVLINITGYVEAEPDLVATSAGEPASGPANGEQSSNLSSQGDQMQSDQATDSQKLRLVTHTLAIKRKKICTQHPVQVDQPARRPIRIDHWPPLAPPGHTSASTLAPTLRPPTSAGPESANVGQQTVSGFGQVWPRNNETGAPFCVVVQGALVALALDQIGTVLIAFAL